MTKDLLNLKGLFAGAVSVVLGAALLPACGSSGHSGTGGHGGSGVGGSIGVGGSVGAGGTTGLLGPCGFAEPEPNDTRDQATPYVLGATVVGCIASEDDTDMFTFTAPATDLAGGYVIIAFTDVGVTGALDVTLYSATDNSMIQNNYKIDGGASLTQYLAVAPGKTYRIAVAQFAGSAKFKYTMNTVYTPVLDSFEPNDTKDTAKPIVVGAPIMAFQTSGYISDPYKGEAYTDWYSVVLAAGSATITVSNVATDIAGDLVVFDPDGVSIGEKYTLDDGANVSLMVELKAAGTYKLSFFPFSGGPLAAGEVVGGVPPDHFTRPYTLKVTQP